MWNLEKYTGQVEEHGQFLQSMTKLRYSNLRKDLIAEDMSTIKKIIKKTDNFET